MTTSAEDPYQLDDRQHDPGHEHAKRRAERVPDAVREHVARGIDLPGGHRLLVGTASWTDPTITEGDVFYPAKVRTPEQRLRYYASRFPLVEVDSSYYAIPAARMAQAWVARTPAGFTFDVKAHALMTGQPSEISRLPKDIREALPAELKAKPRVYGEQLPPELLDEVWARFMDAIAPLVVNGKLGAVLLQFPRWIVPSKKAAALIEDAARRLGDVPGAVELRNHRWFAKGERTSRVLDFLRAQGLAHVMVDGPRGLESSVPPVIATTTPELALVRLHGRRADLWEKARVPTVERYRYLYDDQQLEEWVEPVLEAAATAKRTHVLMNNCHGNYGTTNAVEFGAMVVTLGLGTGDSG
jgi:uncharacterized protein YecE (DUF72 family)